jgi:hypothetical protein
LGGDFAAARLPGLVFEPRDKTLVTGGALAGVIGRTSISVWLLLGTQARPVRQSISGISRCGQLAFVIVGC